MTICLFADGSRAARWCAAARIGYGRLRWTSAAIACAALLLGAGRVTAGSAGDFPLMKIEPADSASNDEFGYEVDLEGTMAVIGKRFGDDHGTDSGSVHLFDAVTSKEIRELVPLDAAPGDQFGTAVAISGSVVIAGAPGNDDHGFDSGSAYLFDAATGEQLHKLLPLDPFAGQDFGFAVAIDGAFAVVGAPAATNIPATGAVYIFDVVTGAQVNKLESKSGSIGHVIDIDGSRVITRISSGVVHILDRDSGELLQELQVPAGSDSQEFGSALAIEGNRALLGSPRDDETMLNAGAAYLFSVESGEVVHKLMAKTEDAGVNDRLGSAVAFSGDNALVGAKWDDHALGHDDSGSAYWFDLSTGEQVVKIRPPDPTDHDEFGRTLAIDGSLFIIGAPADDNFTNSGSAYLGTLAPRPPLGDLDGNGAVDVFDLLELLAAWGACGAPSCPADLDGSGEVDVFDLLELLANWT